MIPRKPMATPAVTIPMINPRLLLVGELRLLPAAQDGYIELSHRYPAGARHLTGASCRLTFDAARQLHDSLARLLEGQS